jgi:hypothetical protein
MEALEMTLTFPNLSQRLAFIHRLLTTHPEKTGLNHFEKQQLEEEYEELLAHKDEDGHQGTNEA